CLRCNAIHNNLDGCPRVRRTHEYTGLLMAMFDAKTLWDSYGIIDGILPFTSALPRADIHELISPDILHQLIKGTFKSCCLT
ncbi:hypothetical protein FA95DRAFT_1453832, partial [Auriscalpium vulgare]